ncbi:hypothetical protein FACS189490_10750 [Clostridia bacterium]|nr:hypothetical protein FACS189490_10750 [Clostridia bacterium]
MKGFADSSGEATYSKTLGLLSAAAQSLRREGDTKYYRFDIQSEYPVGTDRFAYLIEKEQFETDAVARSEFYSISWYCEQTGKNTLAYEKVKNSEQWDPQCKTSLYLSRTISQLDPNEVSVVVTDFINSDFKVGDLKTAIGKYVRDNGASISVFAFKSEFTGIPPLPQGVNLTETQDTEVSAKQPPNNSRPFYVLVFGKEAEAAKLCDAFVQKLAATSYEYYYSDDYTFSSVITNNSFNIEEIEIDGANPIRGDISKEEYENINYSAENTLYYVLKAEKVNIPLAFNALPARLNNSPLTYTADFTLEGVAQSINDDGKIVNSYTKLVPDKAEKAVKVTVAGTDKDGGVKAVVSIDRDALKVLALTSNKNAAKFKLTIDIRGEKKADWEESYSCSRIDAQKNAAKALNGTVDLADIMGYIKSLRGDSGHNKAAHIVVYLKF